MGITENLMIVLNTLVVFAFLSWVFKVILEWRKLKHKNQLHNKLVDKYSNVEELNEFLKSENGINFFKYLSVEGVVPKERLIISISRGIIAGFLGFAFLILGQIFTEETEFFVAFGILIIALGLGFLVSAFVSVKLSKKWGIID